ncbi:hypothetical protein [Roseomonas elaeocarpi]|uniref:Uncharacterized protein n=1 Tax=Roseomonas elaeocarpi TaxID=907779 RepID=A0ABV6JWP3_9PROT
MRLRMLAALPVSGVLLGLTAAWVPAAHADTVTALWCRPAASTGTNADLRIEIRGDTATVISGGTRILAPVRRSMVAYVLAMPNGGSMRIQGQGATTWKSTWPRFEQSYSCRNTPPSLPTGGGGSFNGQPGLSASSSLGGAGGMGGDPLSALTGGAGAGAGTQMDPAAAQAAAMSGSLGTSLGGAGASLSGGGLSAGAGLGGAAAGGLGASGLGAAGVGTSGVGASALGGGGGGSGGFRRSGSSSSNGDNAAVGFGAAASSGDSDSATGFSSATGFGSVASGMTGGIGDTSSGGTSLTRSGTQGGTQGGAQGGLQGASQNSSQNGAPGGSLGSASAGGIGSGMGGTQGAGDDDATMNPVLPGAQVPFGGQAVDLAGPMDPFSTSDSSLTTGPSFIPSRSGFGPSGGSNFGPYPGTTPSGGAFGDSYQGQSSVGPYPGSFSGPAALWSYGWSSSQTQNQLPANAPRTRY